MALVVRTESILTMKCLVVSTFKTNSLVNSFYRNANMKCLIISGTKPQFSRDTERIEDLLWLNEKVTQ